MSNPLFEVMTASEAAERWNKANITVRQACSGYKKARHVSMMMKFAAPVQLG